MYKAQADSQGAERIEMCLSRQPQLEMNSQPYYSVVFLNEHSNQSVLVSDGIQEFWTSAVLQILTCHAKTGHLMIVNNHNLK